MVKQETIEQIKTKITSAIRDGFTSDIEESIKSLPNVVGELSDEMTVSLALKFAKEIPDIEVEGERTT